MVNEAFEEMTTVALWSARRTKSKYYRDYAHTQIKEVIELSGITNEFTRRALAVIEEELSK